MTRSFFLAIEGAIGVGKTTLARMLQPRFKTGLLLEAFEANPFLSDFYANRARYAFQTQMVFLLSRYRQQQTVPALLASSPLIADYTFVKDNLFAHTDFKKSPWYVVKADDKRRARLNCISHLLSMIPYKDLTPKPIKLPPRQKDGNYVRPPLKLQNFIPEKY